MMWDEDIRFHDNVEKDEEELRNFVINGISKIPAG